jgi:hypothetical protein
MNVWGLPSARGEKLSLSGLSLGLKLAQMVRQHIPARYLWLCRALVVHSIAGLEDSATGE